MKLPYFSDVTANGKMKFSFGQSTEKLDLFKLLSFLLTRYIEYLLKRVTVTQNFMLWLHTDAYCSP